MNAIIRLAQRLGLHRPSVESVEEVAPAPAALPVKFREDIRLVIWDLDDTFWRGTLTEGGYTYVDDHHQIVIELAKRGIISSICSNNDYEVIKGVLEERGLWQYFVFPSIAWEAKGPRIKRLVERIGLRPPTVLFIDDNWQNLHQTADLTPEINISEPSIIPHLLTHPQLIGKEDVRLSRLEQYRVLEQKQADEEAVGGDGTAFLRGSDIKVYIEHDVERHIDRAIELINRTNQLNFTKERLSENQDEARAQLTALLRDWRSTAGLIRVVDRYGDYGFVGFFLQSEGFGQQWLKHFCFSCRTLNMYVEHFVYDAIGRPNLEVKGEVLSDVQSTALKVDWISLLPIDQLGAEAEKTVVKVPRVFMRGGCDLQPLMHYMLLNVDEITGEFNDVKNWQVRRRDHSSFLEYSLFGIDDEMLRAAEGLGYDRADFETSFPLGENASPFYLLSFWVDADLPVYRHKETGLELPYYLVEARWQDLISDTELTRHAQLNEHQAARIATLRAEWECVGHLKPSDMLTRYRRILGLIPPTSKVFMTLANEREPEHFEGGEVLDEYHAAYNRVVEQIGAEFSNVVIVDTRKLIKSREELFDLSHLRREVYFRMYKAIVPHLVCWSQGGGALPALGDRSARVSVAESTPA